MGAPALAAPGGRALRIRGTAYPVLLPSVRDPRLHLAAVIVSLQILGQVAFGFGLSIAQILIAIGTCALLETTIAFRRRRTLMWPASALLTGNGIAFVLRVPGTRHGDWWSVKGWWIFAGTAAVGLLSKHLIRWHGRHVFNPSNIGLVLCFLILGKDRADPLDFWWGPMTGWLALALAIIVCGGLAILSRLRLLFIAAGFWVAFAAGVGVVAASGHAMTARWHFGPVGGAYFWWILVTSPEILVFLFFMITDPKTIPRVRPAQLAYAVSVGLLSALLIAPMRTEFGAKVAVLGSLALVCAARPLLERLRALDLRPGRRSVSAIAAGAAVFAGALVAAGLPARPSAAIVAPLLPTADLPAVHILHSSGVSSQLDRPTALRVAGDLVADLDIAAASLQTRSTSRAAAAASGAWLRRLRATILSAAGREVVVPRYRVEHLSLQLRPGRAQEPPTIVAVLDGLVQQATYSGTPSQLARRTPPARFRQTLDLEEHRSRFLIVGSPGLETAPTRAAHRLVASTFPGVHLQDVAARVGLRFRQDDFRFGMWNDVHSMMGGGLCWLDYNDDGWLDLFAVNSYSDDDATTWSSHGGLPRSALFENVHGRFVNVGARSHANVAVQGDGCVAADLNGDGRTDLLVTTTSYNVLLWNNGDGTFTNGTHAARIDAYGTFGWHTGAAVADVNGDGRPDIFVAGYADVNAPSHDSSGGFPLSYQAFRGLLYLNEGRDAHGHSRFRDVALRAGLERSHVDHSLGAVFTDVNGDGRPDLYVANDLDPNRLYLNEPGGALGFHFVEQGRAWGVDDGNAGMGVAAQDYSGDGRPDLFVTNSRGQGHAAFAGSARPPFRNVGAAFARAIGTDATGWGDSWVDLANDGRPDLVLANGAIPVLNVRKDAAPIQVLENLGAGRFADASVAAGLRPGPLVNGRGLAAADFDNDGRVDVAVNSIGGKLVLLRNTGATGHWLDVSLTRFAPGALVTALLPDGRRLKREVQAGGSYLSSEDPRVHFGLGGATRLRELVVRWPRGKVTRERNVAADRIVSLRP